MAGFLEGNLTKGYLHLSILNLNFHLIKFSIKFKDLISLHLLNTVGDFCQDESPECSKLISFLTHNFKWIHEKIEKHPDDPYWHQVCD